MNVSKSEMLVGLALMSWGGAGITKALGLAGWHQFDVLLFAIGIILVSQVQNRSLHARISELEKERVPTNPLTVPAQS